MAKKKRRKKSSRPRLRMTDAEARSSDYNDPCPKCESKSTYVIGGSYGSHSGCHDCHYEWGWSDARGSRVSRAQHKERAASAVESARSKSAESWRMDAPAGEETDMAKAKAKGKKAKKSARGGKKPLARKSPPKKTDGKRDSRIPKVGTVLKAKYKGKDFTAKVLAEGFEFQDKTYGSISKVGSVIMAGKACNGYKLFDLC